MQKILCRRGYAIFKENYTEEAWLENWKRIH